jgi:phosphate transport system permease protein
MARMWIDRFFHFICAFSSVCLVLLLAAILGLLFYGSWPAWQHFGLGFLYDSNWNPVTQVFGAASPLWGTLVSSCIALVVAIPFSFGMAIFIEEQLPARFRSFFISLSELMAGIPSIIYGMWGLFIFAPNLAEYIQLPLQKKLEKTFLFPLVEGAPSGMGLFTAGLILAFMILPYMTAMIRDSLSSVPALLKESAYGLGATRAEVLYRIMIPYCRSALMGAILLGLGRALGETMAVTFVVGNAYHLSLSLIEPSNTITSALANEFSEAQETLHLASLTALGLLLFVITWMILMISRRWRNDT